MKKETRKLLLAKETLRNLESSDLSQVEGASLANTQCPPDACYSTDIPTCHPSYNTCATRLC
jgi:hypothetical protein